MNRNLVIDIGNSMTKLAVFDGSELISLRECLHGDFLKNIKGEEYANVSRCILSSTKNVDKDAISAVESKGPTLVFSPSSTAIPIGNLYASKKTLGADRLANAVGASTLFPQKNCLVVDCGTALTFDFVSSGSEYVGGAISLGLRMRFEALHHYTDKLPLIEAMDYDNSLFVGNDTQSSILLGVINGMVGEIRSTINRASATFEDLGVIMTGGDALFLEKKINSGIFVSRILTLVGLNSILNYNAQYH
ncbi:MAG: type III pantothenate kinase [Bacteroidales bacterium]